jgi:hypothetical protein
VTGRGRGRGRIDETTLRVAQGEAALDLLESVLITLIEGHVVSAEQVGEALDAAIAARRRAAEQECEPAPSRVALGILSVLGNSLAAVPARTRAVGTA